MKDIKENTVSAVNQTINSSDLGFLGDPNAKTRILIVGNSITRHGPKEDIGWPNDWGMAASAPEKDYVHLLYSMLKKSGRDVYMRIRQSADWERTYDKEDVLSSFDGERAFGADIVIFRLGENVPAELMPGFKDALRKFIEYICPKTGRVVFTTCFWKNEGIDGPVRELAALRGEPCVDTCCKDDSMMALGKFAHGGVAMHPGDEGMKMIAETIFPAI